MLAAIRKLLLPGRRSASFLTEEAATPIIARAHREIALRRAGGKSDPTLRRSIARQSNETLPTKCW